MPHGKWLVYFRIKLFISFFILKMWDMNFWMQGQKMHLWQDHLGFWGFRLHNLCFVGLLWGIKCFSCNAKSNHFGSIIDKDFSLSL